LVPPFSVPLYGDSWWFMYIIWSRRYFLDTENRQTCREQIVKPQHHFFLIFCQFCQDWFMCNFAGNSLMGKPHCLWLRESKTKPSNEL
jgi:hypothetical protein